MAVFPVNRQLRTTVSPPDLNRHDAPDGSVPRRTSTASSGGQYSPPDLNRHEAFSAAPQPQLRTAVFPAAPQPPAPDGSVPRLTSTTSSGSGRQCSPPDLNHELRMEVFPPDLNRQLWTAVFARRTSTASFGC